MSLFEELSIVFVSATISLVLARHLDELFALAIVALLWSPGRIAFEFLKGGVLRLLRDAAERQERS